MSPVLSANSAISVLPFGRDYAARVLDTGPMAYCIQGENVGSISYDEITDPAHLDILQSGVYTGVTLRQPGIGDGRTSPFFDSINDYNDIGTAMLKAAFPGPEGSLMIWDFPDPASFNDATLARLFAATDAGATNYIFVAHTGANANIQIDYRAGGIAGQTGPMNLAVQPTTFQCLLLTWSAVNDRVRYYRNGAAATAEDNGLGVWGAQPTRIVIGANTVAPAQPYFGRLAHWVLWSRELTPATVADMAIV